MNTEEYQNLFRQNALNELQENGKLVNDFLNEKYKKEAKMESSELEIQRLTIENLKLQNKQLKRTLLYSIIGFIAGAIVTNIKEILTLMNEIK